MKSFTQPNVPVIVSQLNLEQYLISSIWILVPTEYLEFRILNVSILRKSKPIQCHTQFKNLDE